VAVLQQRFSDLWGSSAAERRSAKAFIDREDFAAWCFLAGLNSAAVRDRLEQRQRPAALIGKLAL
jgi:hypothetical protein